ncbi:MAG: rhodanese-like domain-containing protein, partial [Clostridiaceae bacterium]|nr:rhodanese-like domain-containing protein [Clostridiaceae bacterium]
MFNLFGNSCPSMSMRDAKAALDKDQDIHLIDVRTREEYREGHIPGSLHVSLDQLPWQLEQKLTNKAARIFVYCLSGSRSSQACRFLQRQGYNNVTNIGGIMNWPGAVSTGDN